MAVNYNDSRFQEVEKQKSQALNEVNTMYNNMVNSTDKFYQDQINASNEYAETQKKLQQQQTDFAIEQVNQNKEWAKQDYTKEQKASYSDYQKASNIYGANAESMAARGLTGTGYAESSLVSMYNQYQNRVATARDSYNRAIVEYDAQIKDAQLQNSSKLAEIAFQALQTKLELSLEGFQYKNTLLQQQLNAKNETEDRYYSRWQDVLSQINTENALAEQQRQFNAQLQLQRDEFNWQKEQAAQELSIAKEELSLAKKSASGGSGSSSSGVSHGGGGKSTSSSSKKSSSKKSSSSGSASIKKTSTSSSKSSSNTKSSSNSSTNGWIPASKMANSLGLPAAVKLDNILSSHEYEKKLVNGIAYYRKKQ